MKESNEDPIVAELKRIAKLLALSLVRTETSLREQIKLLHQFGFKRMEIADFLRIPVGTVSSNLSRAKQAEIEKGQD